jgi:HEAT repeat protein
MWGAIVVLLTSLGVQGCGKGTERGNAGGQQDTSANGDPSARPEDSLTEQHWKALTSSSEQKRREAIAYFAQVGAQGDTIARLIALLSDPSTAGLGKTHSGRIGSTREAAARTLLALGEAGEKALRQQGVTALRAGLRDRQAAVREHSAYTLGLLGPLAQAAADDLLEACQDEQAEVRRAAWDAVRQVGVGDPRKYVRLLLHPDAEVARLAAEVSSLVAEVPPDTVDTLRQALRSSEDEVRTAAARLLLRLGSQAAPAIPDLLTAIRQSYPAMVDPMQPMVFRLGSDLIYWQTLAAIGTDAVPATVELLQHGHPLVRYLTAYTLGEIGPAAAEAAREPLKKALQDPFADVAIEAACALLRLGVAQEEARKVLQAAMDAPNAVALSAIAALPRLGEGAKELIPLALAKLDSDNPYARYAAVGLVATLPPEETKRYLTQLGQLTADSEPVIRRQVATVLQQLGPLAGPTASAVAQAWQRETDEVLRDAWIDALLAMAEQAQPAVDVLLQAAADDKLPLARRLRIIDGLPQVGAKEPRLVQSLLDLTQQKDMDIRRAAARALGQVRPLPSAAVQRLVTMAQTDNRLPPRYAALVALIAAGPQSQEVSKPLQALAERNPPDGLALLAQVARANAEKQPQRARQLVRAALSSPRADIRSAAVEALLVLSPTSAELPALQRLLTEPNADVRMAAAQAIGHIGPPAQAAVPSLVALLDEQDPAVQQAAIEALGRLGPAAKAAGDKLLRLSDNPNLAPAVRRTLDKLGVPLPQTPGVLIRR